MSEGGESEISIENQESEESYQELENEDDLGENM